MAAWCFSMLSLKVCSASQAIQLQPDSVKALYRLAQAQHSLKLYKQCIQSCSAALKIRPAAAQLHCLLQRATDALRLEFLTTRHPDVEQALGQAASTAAQQVTKLRIRQHGRCFNKLKFRLMVSHLQSVQLHLFPAPHCCALLRTSRCT